MADRQGPMTPAERQRAFRKRAKKAARPSNVIVLPGGTEPPDGGDDDDIGEVSIGELNARMRSMALQSFDEVGGVEYLKRVAAKNANTYLRFVGQFVTREDTVNLGAFTFIVRKFEIAPGPVPGVIASPVAEHVSGTNRYLVGPGEVIEAAQVTDVEPRDG